jgi:hypothetical protein
MKTVTHDRIKLTKREKQALMDVIWNSQYVAPTSAPPNPEAIAKLVEAREFLFAYPRWRTRIYPFIGNL